MVGREYNSNFMQHVVNELNNIKLGMHHLSQKLHSNAISEYCFLVWEVAFRAGDRCGLEGWQTSCCLLQVLGLAYSPRSFMFLELTPVVTSIPSFRADSILVGASIVPAFHLKRKMSFEVKTAAQG